MGASSALRTISDWTPCELSSSAWSYARLGCQHMPLLHAIASSSSPNLSELTLVDISNTAWALEVLDIPAVKELRALVNFPGFIDFVTKAVNEVHSHGVEFVHFANSFTALWRCNKK